MEMNQDPSVSFEIVPMYCISDSLVAVEGYSISSKVFLSTVVGIMIIWIKFACSCPFYSLIPKISMFALAISCLTISNLPWFMVLTFQTPMQYCSLQCQILLSPPDISATEHCFHFGPAPSFFLELFVIAFCSSPVAYWRPSNLGGPSSSVMSFCFFYCSWSSHSKNTGVVCHPISSEPHIVRIFQYDLSILGGLARHGS